MTSILLLLGLLGHCRWVFFLVSLRFLKELKAKSREEKRAKNESQQSQDFECRRISSINQVYLKYFRSHDGEGRVPRKKGDQKDTESERKKRHIHTYKQLKMVARIGNVTEIRLEV